MFTSKLKLLKINANFTFQRNDPNKAQEIDKFSTIFFTEILTTRCSCCILENFKI